MVGHQPAPVTVDDLKQAWASLAGERERFTWTPSAGEDVIPVIGCVGSAGTTLVSLAIAHAHPGPARVVECCALSSSGLGGASDSELGEHRSGWRRGLRGDLLLERAGIDAWNPADLPPPPAFPGAAETCDDLRAQTVMDLGWRSGEILFSGSWLPTVIGDAPAVVVVAPATEPGFRRLERTLLDVGPERAVAAIVGPRVRRWLPRLRGAGLEHARLLIETGRVVGVPVDARLAVLGVTDAVLPAPLLAVGREIQDLLAHLDPAMHHTSVREGDHS